MRDISLTNAGLLTAFEAARKLHDRVAMPGLVKLKVARIVAICRKEGALVEACLNGVTDRHMKRDDAGKPIPFIRNGQPVHDEFELVDAQAFAAERRAVLGGTVIVRAPMLTEAELAPMTIPPDVSIEPLLPFIESAATDTEGTT